MTKAYTTGEVAQMFSVSARTVQKWIDSGILEGWKLPLSYDRRTNKESILKMCKASKLPIPEVFRSAA